jgi:cytochrome P450
VTSPFVPVHPSRPAKPLSLWQLLRVGSRNFLAIWEEAAFEYKMMRIELLRRTTLIGNGPRWVRQAFVLQNADFERKSPQMRHALKPLLGDGLFVSDGETWTRRRRIVAPIVHASRLAQFAPVMVEATVEIRARWAAYPDGTRIDVLTEMAQLAAEIICRTLFGRTLGAAHAHEIVDAFSDYQRHVGQMALPSLLGLPDWLPRWRKPAVARSVRRIHRVLDEIIASYRADRSTDRNAVIGQLLDARDEETGRPLSPEALRYEAAVLFMAGHETTANTLAWAWYLLSQAPEVEARLHAELDGTLAGRLPTIGDIAALPYTRAVIDETLRLYPPVPLLAREAVRDVSLRRRPLKRGSVVIVAPWLLHRHKLFWDDPDAFIPERFLPGAERPPEKYAYLPFSVGPRVCAGMAFGLTETVLCLATLAQGFALRLAPGARVDPVCRLTLRPEGGLAMLLEPRGAIRGGAPTATAVSAGACPFGHG